MSGTVELGLLPAFVEVVRQGSFTGAADALRLPKSTVSRHVARLERGLGVQLLVRTTRRLRLTEAGEAFFPRAASAVEGVEEAVRALGEREEEPRGRLRVSAPNDLGVMLGGAVADFAAAYPRVRVELSLTGRRVDLVGEAFDCALRASGSLEDSSLVARRLMTTEMGLFAAPDLLQRLGSPRTVDALAERPCVLFRPQGETVAWRLHGPEGERTVEVRGPVAADDFRVVRELVARGVGIGLLPELAFDAATEPLERVLPSWRGPGSALYFVYPSQRHVPAKVRAFRDFLVDRLAA
ncbi:MAG TPA: LysR family transcriptional regulator [Sandaracinaceae bacterium LLY-WYZ-13_1]|nr:LysR family transcriptional regulator [Sandaracinaceae bacterium LLY-WYZ-13_1]